jgi:hypothetical protein
MSEINIDLKTPFTVGDETVDSVVLVAPKQSSRNLMAIMAFKGYVESSNNIASIKAQGMFKPADVARETAVEVETVVQSPEDLAKQFLLILSLNNSDYAVELFTKFKDFVKKVPESVQFNGQPLTDLHWDSMDFNDLLLVSGAYASNFMKS